MAFAGSNLHPHTLFFFFLISRFVTSARSLVSVVGRNRWPSESCCSLDVMRLRGVKDETPSNGSVG